MIPAMPIAAASTIRNAAMSSQLWDVSRGWPTAGDAAGIGRGAITGDAPVSLERIDRLSGSKPGATDRADKLKSFASEFVRTAFRRPLAGTERELYIDAVFRSAMQQRGAA